MVIVSFQNQPWQPTSPRAAPAEAFPSPCFPIHFSSGPCPFVGKRWRRRKDLICRAEDGLSLDHRAFQKTKAPLLLPLRVFVRAAYAILKCNYLLEKQLNNKIFIVPLPSG